MARRVSCGFELNSTTAGVELKTAPTGTVSIVTTPVRSGTYAGRCNPTAATGYFTFTGATVPGYARFYVNFASFPATTIKIFDSGFRGLIKITSGGILQLFEGAGGTQVGSNSSALSLGTWYRVEFEMSNNGDTIKARLNGIEFASYTNGSLNGDFTDFLIGILETETADMYIDDVAMNDSVGSYQNTYPGPGKIVILRPNAEGDNQAWTPSTGADNSALVDEVTPNDATDYVSTNTNGRLDDYDLPNPVTIGIGNNDIINYVAVGYRVFQSAGFGNGTVFARIKAASGGTVDESSSGLDDDGTWTTNNTDGNDLYKTLNNNSNYEQPGTSLAWTPNALDATQIGIRYELSVSTSTHQVSTVWLLIDYTPSGKNQFSKPLRPAIFTPGIAR